MIELTERQEIGDPEKARVRLGACRRAGVRLAADDVGAGNAGLRLLSELRFDLIKVDLGLIQRSVASSASSAVVESVVSLAAHTGALVVGEGIEQPGQIAQLLSLGVRAGQGFLLGRPGSLPHKLAVPSIAGAALAPAEIASPMRAWRQSIGLPV